MKTAVRIAAALIAATPILAPGIAGMPNMPGMPNAAPAAKTGKGVGVVTALDPKSAKITIRHGPIPSLGWPAMTMIFRAAPPALLKAVHIGQTIAFDVRTKGADTDVTAIQPR